MSEDLTKKLRRTDSEKLALVLTTVQKLDARTSSIENRIGTIEIGLGGLNARCDGIVSRLQKLDQKVEERLYDTRPIWEQVVATVAQLQEGQQRLEQNYSQLQEGQQRLEQNCSQLQEGQQRLEKGQVQLQLGQQRIEASQEISRTEPREVKTFLRDILRRMGVFNDTRLTIQADYRDIYDRVSSLELKGN